MQRLEFKISKWLMIFVATLQLALSQVHIKAISVLFAAQVGFYLFLYVLFGLLSIFIMISLKELDRSNMFKILVTNIVTCATGSYTSYMMWTDSKAYEAINFGSIQSSFYLILFGCAVYLVGTVIILGVSLANRKEG